MTTHLSIGAASRFLGVCVNTLRFWHKTGVFVPKYRTEGGHRRYAANDVEKLAGEAPAMRDRKTIAYARVSTQDQRHDLETQVERLKLECATRGWSDAEVIADLGSGMNYKKKRLRKLIAMLCRREIGRLVVLRQDRLLRFGAELIFDLCRAMGCEVVVIDPVSEDPKRAIVEDVLAILTVFSARSNGMRSHSNRKALNIALAA